MTTDGADRDGTLLGKRRTAPAQSASANGAATVQARRTEPHATTTEPAAPGEVRFGPGVPAIDDAVALPPRVAATTNRRRLRWASVLWVAAIAVATVLLWLWLHPRHALAASAVRVTVAPQTVGCDGTAQLRAVVATNGGRGTITYHWRRSDGTDGPLQHYRVGDGNRTAVLPLRWQIRGVGEITAVATIDVSAPSHLHASAAFAYVCG